MTQIQTQDNVIGLTLQLQKLSVGISPIARYSRENTVLGHFDDLVITKITRWLDFSPRNDWENSKNQNAGNEAVSHYPLKLLFPDWGTAGDPAGFDFESWKAPEVLLESSPCMTVVLLNLTDTYKKRAREKLLPDFLTLLTEKYAPEPPLEEMHCCVLPSLGYSDFCILMAGSDWNPAFKLVECLHDLTVEDPDAGTTAVLSTDYMMPVFHRGSDAISSSRFKGLELSVRVNLSPGTTAQQLADLLPEVQVYRTSGGSDCVLWAKEADGHQKLIDFLLDSKTGSLVIDVASTPQLLIPHSDNAPNAGTGKQQEVQTDYIDKFDRSIDAYGEGLIRHRRHLRQANSLRELSASIRSVCSQSHSGELRNIMEGLVKNVSYCLNESACRMSQDDWDFDEMELRISEFTNIVSSFLSDLSRSDCFFMDRERYNHASISSATSLLIAYNQWLDGFTNAVSTATDKDNQSNCAFLVTSGGQDQTKTVNAFCFLEPSVKDGMLFERVPLVTQMSEMSLFDFSGTILRSAHECMHFSGARRRKDRVNLMLKFVNTLLSRLFVNALLSDEKIYKFAHQSLEELGSTPELQRDVEDAYKVCWKKLAENILAQLNACFDLSITAGWNESELLCRNVSEWIYETLMQAFSGYEMLNKSDGNKLLATNELARRLYELTQQAQRRFFEECDKQCRAHKISTVIFSFGAKRQDIIAGEDLRVRRKTDAVLSEQVQLILSRLLISDRPENMPAPVQPGETSEEQLNRIAWQKKFPFFELTYSNLYHILKSTEDIFSESFADVAACESLGTVLEDYLLMHVYEDWDIDSALKTDMTTVYRISAVLRVCFPGDLREQDTRLTEEARGRMEAAVQRLIAHGMPDDRLDSEKLCDRIDILLGQFAAEGDVGEPLIEYLRLCQSDYALDETKKKLKPFYDSFHAIRLLSIDPMEGDVHSRLLAMYDALIDRGGKYHNNFTEMPQVANN